MNIATKILASATLIALVSPVQATYFTEMMPNDTLAQAQSMDSFFSLDYDADIGDMSGFNTSTIMPHASALPVENGGYDYYSFTLTSSSTVILDIDYGMPGFDAVIGLWYSDGTYIAQNDDYYSLSAGSGGSVSSLDSFIQIELQAGSYVVGVASFPAYGGWNGWDTATDISNPIPTGVYYTLHTSVGAVPEAETYAMMLAGLGLVGAAATRRRG